MQCSYNGLRLSVFCEDGFYCLVCDEVDFIRKVLVCYFISNVKS